MVFDGVNITGWNRNEVCTLLYNCGYEYLDWVGENGTILEATKVCAGITIDIVTVYFNHHGYAQ